jgi:hypothetical protein
MLETGIVALMAADTTLTGLVGNRTYPTIMPQNARSFPCVVYTDVSADTIVNLDRTAVSFKRIQFDCRSTNYADTKAVQAELHNLFDAYQGTLSDGTVVLYVERGIDMDQYDKDAKIYRAISDWTFQF